MGSILTRKKTAHMIITEIDLDNDHYLSFQYFIRQSLTASNHASFLCEERKNLKKKLG